MLGTSSGLQHLETGSVLCNDLHLAMLLLLSQIHWLLDDEIVSALRHPQPITTDTLSRVATHVYSSQGRPSCHCEAVPLQFVFGPENSLEKFREVREALPLQHHFAFFHMIAPRNLNYPS